MLTCRCHADQATQKSSASLGLFLTLANHLSFAVNSTFSAVRCILGIICCILEVSACSLGCAGRSLHCVQWEALITLLFIAIKIILGCQTLQQKCNALLRQSTSQMLISKAEGDQPGLLNGTSGTLLAIVSTVLSAVA